MNKKILIALADTIKKQNESTKSKFNMEHIEALAEFCQSQNPNFKRERWISYILGECGSNGGKIKK